MVRTLEGLGDFGTSADDSNFEEILIGSHSPPLWSPASVLQYMRPLSRSNVLALKSEVVKMSFLHDEDKTGSLYHELGWVEISPLSAFLNQNTNLQPVLYIPVRWAGLGLACRA